MYIFGTKIDQSQTPKFLERQQIFGLTLLFFLFWQIGLEKAFRAMDVLRRVGLLDSRDGQDAVQVQESTSARHQKLQVSSQPKIHTYPLRMKVALFNYYHITIFSRMKIGTIEFFSQPTKEKFIIKISTCPSRTKF